MFNNIGFIGSGPIAQALAGHLVAAQIQVLISNSRGPDSLTDLVAELGDGAQAVTVEQAAKADLVFTGAMLTSARKPAANGLPAICPARRSSKRST